MNTTRKKLKKWEKPEIKVLSVKKTLGGPGAYTYENAFYNDFS